MDPKNPSIMKRILLPLLLCQILLLYKGYAQASSFQINQLTLDRARGAIRMEVELGETIDFPRLAADEVEIREQLEGQSPEVQKVIFIDTSQAGRQVFYFRPRQDIFLGEARTYTLRWKGDQQSVVRRLGSISNPITLGVESNFWNLLVLGALLLSLLLIVLSELIPKLREGLFKRKYILPYRQIQQEGVNRLDPITTLPFQADQPVVVACHHLISRQSWESSYLGSCEHDPCFCRQKGALSPDARFFSQQGNWRQTNWLWFGSLGGFLAWGIWTLTGAWGESAWLEGLSNQMLGGFLGAEWLDQGFLGLALGLGLSLGLAWVEEKGQSRRFSWRRVLLRSLLGGLIGGLIFLLGMGLKSLLGINSTALDMVSWLLFGLALGWVLSIGSSIERSRGILGGIGAGSLAFLVYFVIYQLSQDAPTAKMISFLSLGGVLGFTLVSLVSRLEKFSLELLSPRGMRGQLFPIDKWLKQGMDIFIGTDPSCYVLVSWQDKKAQPFHALLQFSNNQIFLTAYEPVFVNGRLVENKEQVVLEHGYRVQLGKGGATIFRVNAKGEGGIA
jgi:hypothetical protein